MLPLRLRHSASRSAAALPLSWIRQPRLRVAHRVHLDSGNAAAPLNASIPGRASGTQRVIVKRHLSCHQSAQIAGFVCPGDSRDWRTV